MAQLMFFNPIAFLVTLEAKINRILSLAERIVVTMVTRAEYNAKLDAVAADLLAEIEQIKAAIEAKVPEAIDLSPEFEKLSLLGETIKGIIPDPVEPVEPEAPVE